MKILEMKDKVFFSEDTKELLEDAGVKYRKVAENVLEINTSISKEGIESLSVRLATENINVENVYAYSKVNKDIATVKGLFSDEKRNSGWLFDEDLYHIPLIFTFDDFIRNIVALEQGISQRYFNEIKLSQIYAGFYLLRRELRRDVLSDAFLLSDKREKFIDRIVKVYDMRGDYHETLEKIRYIGIQVGGVFPTFTGLDEKMATYIMDEG